MKTYKVELQVSSVEHRTVQAKNAREAMDLVQQQVDEEGLDADVVSAGILAEKRVK